MPVPRQLLTLPFALGVDTKTDPKQVSLGKLLALENGVFGTLKQLRKRNGYTATPRRITTASGYSRLDSASALTAYRDELVAVGRATATPTESRLYSYADGADAWVDKAALTPCAVSTRSVARGTVARTGVDGATLTGGLQVYAWEESGGVRYSVQDTDSGQTVVASALVAANAAKPRVVPLLDGALIYYINTSAQTLVVRSVLPALASTLGPATTLTSVVPGTNATLATTVAKQTYDVTTAGVQLLVAFGNDVGTVTVRRYDPAAPTTPAVQDVVAAASAPDVVGLAFDSTANQVLCFFAAGQSLLATATDALLAVTFPAASTLSTLAAGLSWTQAGAVAVPTASSAERFRLWATFKVNATGRFTTALLYTNGASVASTASTLSMVVASKPWVYGGRAFVLLAFVARTTGSPSGLQNQLVAVSDSQTGFDPVARLLYTTAAGAPSTAVTGSTPALPFAQDVGGDRVRVATLEATTVGATVGDVQTVAGVTSVDLDFSTGPLSDNRSELGGSLLLGGGVVFAYDGANLVEQGFFLWPDELTVTATGTSGSLSAGTYQWVACYEWTDNNGLVHRSAPSLPASLTVSATNTATVVVSTLPLTRKDAASPVSVVVYRTLANGTTFYRASSLTAPTANNPAAFTVSITDALSDADLQARPQLYTTGGVVENVMPGPLDGLTVHRGRLWGIDSTNRLRLYYSRQVQAGAPVEFSDVLVLDVDARGGDVVALASLDDKLIVFKRTQIFFVAGQGPDATGSQNDFSDSVLVTTDAGCVDGRSVVTTPVGLMFQTAKGIFLLDRSLAVSYLGADVEAYNAATVESSQLIPTTNQVRFVLSTGVALVFDYLVQQWSVFTNHPAVDSVIWNDTFCWLRADGVAMREDSTRFDDDGAFVSLKIKTGWITMSSDEGGTVVAATGNRRPTPSQQFQRVRRLLVLGQYQSAHQLRVQVGFDFDAAPAQDVTIEPPALPTYGTGPTYGDESPFGGEWLPYQWRVDLSRQKCQAVQVTIFDQRDGDAVGEGVRLSALAVDVGIKTGSTRVPMNRVVG